MYGVESRHHKCLRKGTTQGEGRVIAKYVRRCRNVHAKNHANKVYMAVCRQGRDDGMQQNIKHT